MDPQLCLPHPIPPTLLCPPVISPSLYLNCVLALPTYCIAGCACAFFALRLFYPVCPYFATTPVLDQLCFSLLCAVFTLSVPVFRIRIQFRIQSGQWTRIRSTRAKMTHKNRRKLWNFMFWSAWCSLLRAEGFFCSLDVLYGSLEIGELQFCSKKYLIVFSAINCWSSKSWIWIRSRPGSVFSLKCWIRIRIKWIRIRTLALSIWLCPLDLQICAYSATFLVHWLLCLPFLATCFGQEYFLQVATVLAKQLINIRKQKNRTYQATSRVRFISEGTWNIRIIPYRQTP